MLFKYLFLFKQVCVFSGPDETVAMWSCIPALKQSDPSRPETREYPGDQQGPSEAG